MKGPAPKPLELRVLHGTAAERARAAVPKPRRALPRCPEHLDTDEARYWKLAATDLYDAGLFTVIDKWAFEQLCTVHARRLRAHAEVEKSGEVIRTALVKDDAGNVIGGGNIIQNPWLAVENRAAEQELRLLAEFGMTPSARTRVKAEVPDLRTRTPQRKIMAPDDDASKPANVRDALKVLTA